MEYTPNDRINSDKATSLLVMRTLSTYIARSVQLHASRREDQCSEVSLAVIAQGAAYGRQGLDRQGDESGI